jgi:hypothetical protein
MYLPDSAEHNPGKVSQQIRGNQLNSADQPGKGACHHPCCRTYKKSLGRTVLLVF